MSPSSKYNVAVYVFVHWTDIRVIFGNFQKNCFAFFSWFIDFALGNVLNGQNGDICDDHYHRYLVLIIKFKFHLVKKREFIVCKESLTKSRDFVIIVGRHPNYAFSGGK